MCPTNQSTGTILLDGGMGHQLKAMGVTISGQVGTLSRFMGVCAANIESPQLVIDAHLAFIDAGADMITTNSYAVTPRVLALNPELTPRNTLDGLLVAACKAAVAAKDARPERSVRIAGCLPPLAESYRPDRVGSYEENLQTYRDIVSVISPYCDELLCETMSSVDEARAACTAAAEAGLPVSVAWTLDENEPVLRSKETVQAAVDGVAGLGVTSYMFNCTSPEVISEAIPLLKNAKGLPDHARIGAYANGFLTAANGSGEYRDLTPEEYYENFVLNWLESGATIVGGCCGIFPEHIQEIRHRLDQAHIRGDESQ